VTRHLAFIGDASVKAAEAFECVYEQSPDKAWTFRDYIFTNQDQLRASGNNSAALLKTWVAQLGGIDIAKFNASFDSGKYTNFVQQEQATAQQLKIPGTPSIFVGQRLVQGAGGGVPTVAEIGAVVDQAIAQKQGR
jgi:protein-disulfide isomerase